MMPRRVVGREECVPLGRQAAREIIEYVTGTCRNREGGGVMELLAEVETGLGRINRQYGRCVGPA
jgi:hypothetical protein